MFLYVGFCGLHVESCGFLCCFVFGLSLVLMREEEAYTKRDNWKWVLSICSI